MISKNIKSLLHKSIYIVRVKLKLSRLDVATFASKFRNIIRSINHIDGWFVRLADNNDAWQIFIQLLLSYSAVVN